jgi:hypothetical protein
MTTEAGKRWKEAQARFVGALVYLDEPQVVLLDHGADSKIIGVAIDKDGFNFPFLGAEISYSQWLRYKREFVDLRYLFLLPRWKRWYIFDLARMSNDQVIPLERADRADFKNEEFLPSHGFFARDHTETIDEEEAAVDIASQRYSIDGAWEPIDISLFFARISDLYAFFLGLFKFASEKTTPEQKRALIKAFTDHPLRGGSSYVNLYGDLKGLVGFEERLAMGGIVKQSPGHVDIEGKAQTLTEINSAFECYMENYDVLREQYNALHGYLGKMRLLRHPDRFETTGPVASHIKKQNQEFAGKLGIDCSTLDKLTRNSLLTSKLLMSHWRRLDRYYLFFAEGRVRLPADDNHSNRFVANSPSIDEISGK